MAISAAALPSSADLVNVATGFAPATARVSGASDPAAATARAASESAAADELHATRLVDVEA